MGLDFVELVMEVESHFGITIKNDEIAGLRSVGGFVSLIRDRITAGNSTPSAGISHFEDLQKLVCDVTGNSAIRIRPSESLVSKLSASERRRLWDRLPDLLGRDPWPLRRPRALRGLLVVVVISSLIVTIRYLAVTEGADGPGWPLVWIFSLLVWAILSISLHFLTVGFRSTPPKGWSTFGEISQKLAGTVVATKQLHLATDESILEELRPIFVDILGVRDHEIVPTALLIEDLKVG